MDHSQIEDLIEKRKIERTPYAEIKRVNENTFSINGHKYILEENVRDAFDILEFSNAFNPIFTHFDYIVGDWGYGQLRLKGFYADNRQVDQNLKKAAIPDYLVDYTNFGSNYFVLHNLEVTNRPEIKKNIKQNKKSSHSQKTNKNHRKTKTNQSTYDKHKSNHRRKFTIRQKNGD